MKRRGRNLSENSFMEITTQPVDTKRRSFLKWGLFGVGAFVVGRFTGGDFLSSRKEPSAVAFRDFRVVEDNTELRLYNREGEEIFIIEKDGF